MLNKLTDELAFHGRALALRGQRQQVLAANIANADTPGYIATESRFEDAMRDAVQSTSPQVNQSSYSAARASHIALKSSGSTWSSTHDTPSDQPSADRNTVDMDRERARFADNALHYEATLRFISGNARTMLSAIQGQ